MRINHKMLSIPPYLSTSWKNIVSLHVENRDSTLILIVTLINGKTIEIPHLEEAILEAIFASHAKFLESEQQHIKPGFEQKHLSLPTQEGDYQIAQFAFPLSFPMGTLENLGGALQHNQEQAHSPDVPPEVLEKIASVIKAIGIENSEMIPKAEPHCNCMFCQISRTIHETPDPKNSENKEKNPSQEEIITDDDLKFRDWVIAQEAEKLYIVTNPLDEKENYHVFLGQPIGCTCGEKNCEHIRAVLSS